MHAEIHGRSTRKKVVRDLREGDEAAARAVEAGILEGLEEFGIELDPELNKVRRGDQHFISKASSRVKIAVIPTDEELEISRISVRIVEEGK